MADQHLRGKRGSSDILVMNVLPEELTATIRVFDAHANIPRTAYYVQAVSETGEYRVVITQCERTNTPAAMSVGEAIDDFRPRYLILTGIGGAMLDRDGVAPGDVVVADYIAYSEFTKNVEGRALRRFTPYDHPSIYLRAQVAEPLIVTGLWRNHIPMPHPAGGEPKALIGNIVAGEKVRGDATSEDQRRFLQDFDAALAVDMESYGFARGIFQKRRSSRYNPMSLVIRGISDVVETADSPTSGGTTLDNNATRRKWKPYAAATAAAFTRAVADALLEAAAD